MVSKHVIQCPVCQGAEFASKAKVCDDRYGEPNNYELAKCLICGHLSTAPRLREIDLPMLYSNYYPRKSTNVLNVVSEAEKILRPYAAMIRWWNGTNNQGQYLVRSGDYLLDIGCGSGTSLLEAKALGAIAYGIEADPNVKPIAKELGLNIHFGSLHDSPFPNRTFDLIVLNQVIEHLPDPDQALLVLRKRLNSNGRMVLVFPNINSFWCRLFGLRWINWHVPYHLHHFNKTSFKKMVTRCGYQVKTIRTITPNVWTLLQIRACLARVEQGKPSPLWAVSAPLQAASSLHKKVSYAAVNPLMKNFARRIVLLTLSFPISLANRVLDAIGIGDSIMVEIVPAESV